MAKRAFLVLVVHPRMVPLPDTRLYLLSLPIKSSQLGTGAPFQRSFVLFGRETAILLRSQNATSSSSHGGRRYLPYAFTEHGAIMAASVLNSKRAIDMSIFVVRAFVQMRHALLVKQQIVSKLTELEARLDEHDADIQELIEAIQELMTPPPSRNRRIGFEAPNNSAKKQTKTIAGGMASGQ